MMQKNIGLADQSVRLFLAVTLLLGGYFWVAGVWSVVLLVLGGVMAATATLRWCPIYVPFGWDTGSAAFAARKPVVRWAPLMIACALLLGGAWGSVFLSTKLFLEHFNRMNGNYKQTLFHTGKGNVKESKEYDAALQTSYKEFMTTYETYRPFVLRKDTMFASDLQKGESLIKDASLRIAQGSYPEAHTTLEQVRPIFQDILKRNGFSMLAIALVDFHDAMELVITAADAKDPVAVEKAYLIADEKLRAVEAVAQDDEIAAIRHSLDAVRTAAQEGRTTELPTLAATMKSAFVKVYLARG